MGQHETLTIEIDGMTCAACVGRAERAIAAVAGVEKAEVNLATHGGRVTLSADAGPEMGRARVGRVGAAGYPVVSARIRLAIDAMTGASSVARVESALQAVPGVLTATVNPADNTASVSTLSPMTRRLSRSLRPQAMDSQGVLSPGRAGSAPGSGRRRG